MGDRYIQNVHVADIRCTTEDKKLSVVFPIAVADKYTGKQAQSGYTKVNEEQYESLVKTCRLFTKMVELKKLIVYDKAPADAVSPHEALVSARSDARKFQGEAEKLKKETDELKAALADIQKKYDELAASGGGDTEVKKGKKG